MKVQITECNSLHEMLLASGIRSLLEEVEIESADVTIEVTTDVTTPGSGSCAAIVQPVPSGEGDAVTVAEETPHSAKPRKIMERKGKVPEPSVPAEAPRVTIRSRVLASLKTGPKDTRQIVSELIATGVNTSHELIGQHLYLCRRDGKVTRDDDTNKWSLA